MCARKENIFPIGLPGGDTTHTRVVRIVSMDSVFLCVTTSSAPLGIFICLTEDKKFVRAVARCAAAEKKFSRAETEHANNE